MADSGDVADGADDSSLAGLDGGAASDGELELLGAAGGGVVSSEAGLRIESGTGGAVVGRLEGAVAGLRVDTAVEGGRCSPLTESSILESRLVTLNQLTGRTRVLACVRGVGLFAPSAIAGLCGSLGAKAALSLLNSVPTFLSPFNDEMNGFLLSWDWPCDCAFLLLSSDSRCFRCFCSSCLFFRSSSFLRCLSISLGAVLGRSSCGMKPEG